MRSRSPARWRAQLGVTCHPHEKFQTAVVKGRDRARARGRVDVATARTEFYGAPGALPEVERSTLRHDLARRDFTINAMATSLRPDDLGATYDFFGGYPRPASAAPCGCCTTSASSRTRRACCGRSATRRGSVSHGRAHAVAGARLHRDAAGRGPGVGAAARRAARPARRGQRRARRSSAWRRSASTARFTRSSTPGRTLASSSRETTRASLAREPFAGRGAGRAGAACLPVRRMGAARDLRLARRLKLRRRDQDVVAERRDARAGARRAPGGDAAVPHPRSCTSCSPGSRSRSLRGRGRERAPTRGVCEERVPRLPRTGARRRGSRSPATT